MGAASSMSSVKYDKIPDKIPDKSKEQKIIANQLKKIQQLEIERNEAIMNTVHIVLNYEKQEKVWKKKYTNERRKVSKLWRSYCMIKYPQIYSKK